MPWGTGNGNTDFLPCGREEEEEEGRVMYCGRNGKGGEDRRGERIAIPTTCG